MSQGQAGRAAEKARQVLSGVPEYSVLLLLAEALMKRISGRGLV